MASKCTTLKCEYDCYKNKSDVEICFCKRGEIVDSNNASACQGNAFYQNFEMFLGLGM